MTGYWSGLSGAPAPFDPYVGPFPEAGFLESWYETLGSGDRIVAGAGDTILPLVTSAGEVSIAGAAEVTDYHSPLGSNIAGLVESLQAIREENSRVVLDSLPEQSAMAIHGALSDIGVAHQIDDDGGTAVIVVETSYLDRLSKKHRHEIRRKHRRFAESVGEPQLVVSSDGDGLDRFFSMHRRSTGKKAEFLTDERESFFRSLLSQPGWQLAELQSNGLIVASLLGYSSPDTYYVYNSAYDHDYREVSPGIVVLYLLIEHLIEDGCRRIDLLKGDEVYKFRMGAELRPLYRVTF